MRYETVHAFSYGGPLGEFDEQTDRLYEALLRLDGVEDPDVAANLSTGAVDVTMVVEAGTGEDAAARAVGALRAAIHEIGGSTPGWERYVHEITDGGQVLV